MRIVTLTYTGDFQKHLVSRLASEHELVGYVTHNPAPQSRVRRWRELWQRYQNPVALVDHLLAKRLIQRQEEQVHDLHRALYYRDGQPPTFPDRVPHIPTQDVNSPACVDFLRAARPEVIVVNGTNLLRAPALEAGSLCRYGIVNIHTGLSPYCRGGSCNLHAILHRQIQFVGVTVHYINAGVDSGDLILTGRPAVEPGDTIESLEEKVFHLGEELLLVGLADLLEGRANRVKQWTPGRLFLRKTGYEYRPRLRVLANQILQEQGLIRQYLAHRAVYDEGVRLITSPRSEEVCGRLAAGGVACCAS